MWPSKRFVWARESSLYWWFAGEVRPSKVDLIVSERRSGGTNRYRRKAIGADFRRR